MNQETNKQTTNKQTTKPIRKSIRIFSYVVLFAILVAAVQLKKQKILNDRNKPIVSLPSEIEQHGWAVDLEKVKRQDLLATSPLTLRTESSDVTSSPSFKFPTQINSQSNTNSKSRLHSKSQSTFFLVSFSQKKKIRIGQIVVDAQGKVLGSVVSADSSASLSHGMYRVFISLKPDVEPSEAIRAFIVLGKQKQELSVLSEAVELKKNKAFVWISEENRAKRVEVQLGSLFNERYQILSGLKEGQLVIVEGQKYLKEGAKLRVRHCKLCANSEVES